MFFFAVVQLQTLKKLALGRVNKGKALYALYCCHTYKSETSFNFPCLLFLVGQHSMSKLTSALCQGRTGQHPTGGRAFRTKETLSCKDERSYFGAGWLQPLLKKSQCCKQELFLQSEGARNAAQSRDLFFFFATKTFSSITSRVCFKAGH